MYWDADGECWLLFNGHIPFGWELLWDDDYKPGVKRYYLKRDFSDGGAEMRIAFGKVG